MFLHTKADTCVQEAKADVAISYSYHEKDDVQRMNFDFFVEHGIGDLRRFPLLRNTDVVVIVSGEECGPCSKLPVYNERHRYSTLLPTATAEQSRTSSISSTLAVTLRRVVSFETVANQIWKGKHMVLMFRTKNVGMDIAAHNVRNLLYSVQHARHVSDK